MDREYFLDKFRRGLEMEEVMNSLLAGMLLADELPAGLSAEDSRRIREILTTLRDDSARHSRFNAEQIEALTRKGGA